MFSPAQTKAEAQPTPKKTSPRLQGLGSEDEAENSRGAGDRARERGLRAAGAVDDRAGVAAEQEAADRRIRR